MKNETAEIANPVRAGFDQFLVQPHLEFCRAIKLKPISKTVTRGRAVPDMGLPVLCYCVLVIRARTYEYAQGRMSIHVYCVLVVRAWTYEYGLNQMYVGGFFTGNRPPVFPP